MRETEEAWLCGEAALLASETATDWEVGMSAKGNIGGTESWESAAIKKDVSQVEHGQTLECPAHSL